MQVINLPDDPNVLRGWLKDAPDELLYLMVQSHMAQCNNIMAIAITTLRECRDKLCEPDGQPLSIDDAPRIIEVIRSNLLRDNILMAALEAEVSRRRPMMEN